MRMIIASFILMSSFTALAVGEGLPVRSLQLNEYDLTDDSVSSLGDGLTGLILRSASRDLVEHADTNAHRGNVIAMKRSGDEPTRAIKDDALKALENAVSARITGTLLRAGKTPQGLRSRRMVH